MNKLKLKETFKSYCKNNGLQELLNLWDYELNDIKPYKIGPHSTKQKIWFKCPKGLHDSHPIMLNSLCKSVEKAAKMDVCPSCKSIGQHIIDNYGKEYLDKIWSDKNDISYFEINKSTYRKKIWLRCLNDETHPDYDVAPGNFEKTHNCPYCAHKRVCHTNSLGYIYPQVLNKWSDKNDKSPYEYIAGGKQKIWFKCENQKHLDYQQKIENAITYEFRCSECGRENQKILRGEENPNWKGGITPTQKLIRKSPEYNEWRTKVYEADNYLCQCCLNPKNNRLRAHHIQSFSSHEELRTDPMNGIILCTHCHDSSIPGGFHNLYGTKDKTPEELQEYINNKRKELGILIPFNINEYIKQKKTQRLENWLTTLNSSPIDESWEEPLTYEPKEA